MSKNRLSPAEKAELREYRASLSRTLRDRGMQTAEAELGKYSPDQPRDERGRWASGGGSAEELEATGGANVGPGGSFVGNPILDVMSRQYGTSTYGRPLHEVARIVAQGNLEPQPRGNYTIRSSDRFMAFGGDRAKEGQPTTAKAYELTHPDFAVPTVRVEPNAYTGERKIQMSGTGGSGLTSAQVEDLKTMLDHAVQLANPDSQAASIDARLSGNPEPKYSPAADAAGLYR